MNGKALAMTGSKTLAAAAMAIVLGFGLAGCKSEEKKSDQTSGVPVEPANPGNSGGTVDPPPLPVEPANPGNSGGTVDPPPPVEPANPGNSGGTVDPPPSGVSNSAPLISGKPVTSTKIGVPYSFKPTATDADGDRLTYSIKGKPEWATFDPATGTLGGTPPAGSSGTYTGVQIVVSDGKNSTSLAPFSISVLEPAIGSAELAWQPPTANEDGTALTDLSGYVIRYGKSAGALNQSVRITNPGTTAYVVENLVEGTWYFSLSSINKAGIESRPTGYVSKTIR